MAASLTARWATNGTNVAGFIVERKNPTTGVFEEAGRTNATTLVFTDTNLLYAKAYTYRVAAFNSAGVKGPYSEEATGTTGAEPIPSAPTGLTVRPV